VGIREHGLDPRHLLCTNLTKLKLCCIMYLGLLHHGIALKCEVAEAIENSVCFAQFWSDSLEDRSLKEDRKKSQ
jgi:hypothetical protein